MSLAVVWEKPDFFGREALLAARAEGWPCSQLVEVTMREDRLALYGQEIIQRDGTPLGLTTSGCWSHKAQVPVAIGYVSGAASIGDAFVATGAFALDLPGGAVQRAANSFRAGRPAYPARNARGPDVARRVRPSIGRNLALYRPRAREV